MSLFGKNIFSWKSAAAQKKEQKEYEKWAFPHGEKQRENMISLLTDVFNKNDKFNLFTYLTCKEMYEKATEDLGSRDDALEMLITNRLNMKQQVIKKPNQNEWLIYIALVLADEDIKEDCEYPTKDMIIQKAQEIGESYGFVL